MNPGQMKKGRFHAGAVWASLNRLEFISVDGLVCFVWAILEECFNSSENSLITWRKTVALFIILGIVMRRIPMISRCTFM